jgi:hypothetical protein
MYSPAMRLRYDQLQQVLDSLTESYERGQLDIVDYVDAWDDVIEASGWTLEEVGQAVDSGWSTGKRRLNPLSRC